MRDVRLGVGEDEERGSGAPKIIFEMQTGRAGERMGVEDQPGVVLPAAVASRTRARTGACMGLMLVTMAGVGVTLGVTLKRSNPLTPGSEIGPAGKPVGASEVGDQIPLVVYRAWRGDQCNVLKGQTPSLPHPSLTHQVSAVARWRRCSPGCPNAPRCASEMPAALQAAFAPGDCLSSQDNGFSDQEKHRFMFTCSDSGEILHQEWKTSPKCQGTPEVQHNRTAQTEVTWRLVAPASACAGVFLTHPD